MSLHGSLHDEILAFDRARAAGRAAAAPSPGGKVVAVVSSEAITTAPGGGIAARLGLAVDDVVVVAVPGPRVQRADGEVARSICLAVAWSGARSVVILANESSPFRSPSFGVPGPAPSGESFPTVNDLVRHSAAQLRASVWLPRGTAVLGFIATAGGTLESAVSGEPSGASSTISQPGPVSFFGSGPVANLMTAPDPIDHTPEWVPPPPVAGGPTLAGPPRGPVPSLAAGPIPSLGAMPASGPSPSLGSLAGAVGAIPSIVPPPPPIAPPALSRPLALDAPAALEPPPRPVAPEGPSILNRHSEFGGHVPSILDTPIPDSRPEPRQEQRQRPRQEPRLEPAPQPRTEQRRQPPPPPPPAPPPLPRSAPEGDLSDDPFERAEKILERLRRERRK